MKRYALSPKFRTLPIFTAKEVVNMFLDTCEHWFTMRENQLYGMKEECRTVLMEYVETGIQNDRNRFELGYVLDKFDNEWLGDENHVFLKDTNNEN